MSAIQTFTSKFKHEFVVDSFDELSEMEVRSEKGRVTDGLIKTMRCVGPIDATFCNKFAR